MRRVQAIALVLAAIACAPGIAQAEPLISRTCNHSADCAGWFTGPVALDWTVAAGDVVRGCVDVTISEDTPGRQEGCIARDHTDVIQQTVTITLDQTPPVVTGIVAGRPPDHAGWYTHPVTFTALGSDVTSGIASCAAPGYDAPDTRNAPIVATCRDVAGNAAARAFAIDYDATPPDPGPATATAGDHRVRLAWPAAAIASVVRSPGLDGQASDELYRGGGTGFTDRQVRNGERYRYVVTLSDEAGNAASRELFGVPGPRLIGPERRAAVAGPPLLRWTPVRGARYYNVQLFRGAHKILSAWPRRPRLQLEREWRFRGKPRRLIPGRYRWYVWPGEGPRAERRYGPRIGRRSFVIG